MILGQSIELTVEQQLEIGKWAVKTAMVAEKAIVSPNQFTHEETALMYGDAGLPPIHVNVVIAAVDDTVPPFGCSAFDGYLTTEQGTIHVRHYTLHVGQLVLSVMRPSPPSSGFKSGTIHTCRRTLRPP